MKKTQLTRRDYNLIIDLWAERMTSFSEQLDARAEAYSPGSPNRLELEATAEGIRLAIDHFAKVETKIIGNIHQELYSEV